MSLFVNENPILGDLGTGAVVRQGAGLGDFKPQIEEYISVINLTAASPVNQDVFIASQGQNYQITGVTVTFGVAGGAGAAVTVQKCTGTTAAGSGTAVLTGTVALTGVAANTPQSGTLVSTTATLQLAGGPVSAPTNDRLAIVLSGTLTGLADCLVQIRIKRI